MSYDFYYWPIPFRGHPIRFILAYAGAEWDEHGFDDVAALKNLPVADKPYPFLAPPVLHDRETDTWLSQMPAIAMYIGRKHDLISDPDQSLRIVCDASDILLEITRNHGATLWDADSWAEFRANRLPMWMQLHEALCDDTEAYLFGRDTPGLADLVLSGLWQTMTERLPPLREDLETHAPTLTAIIDRVVDLPAIAALRAEWAGRRPLYCAGQIEQSLLTVLNMRTQ